MCIECVKREFWGVIRWCGEVGILLDNVGVWWYWKVFLDLSWKVLFWFWCYVGWYLFSILSV